MWKEYKVTINGIKYRIKYIETEAPESKKDTWNTNNWFSFI